MYDHDILLYTVPMPVVKGLEFSSSNFKVVESPEGLFCFL